MAYPVSNEFKRAAEISLSGLEVIAYREGGGENEKSYWEKDITEWVINIPQTKNAINDSSGGYAASISPTLTLTLINSTEVDALLKDLGAGTLSVRVSTYNFLEDAGGGVGEKVKLFDGMLYKQTTEVIDVYGKVYQATFAHPLVYYDKSGDLITSDLPDPYDYSQIVGGDSGTGVLQRRDIVSIFDSINALLIKDIGVSLNYNFKSPTGVGFGYPCLQETHVPILRETNGPTGWTDEHQILGSEVENFVNVQGITYNPNTDTIIVAVDDLQLNNKPVTEPDDYLDTYHQPRLCFLTLGDENYQNLLRMESKPVPINWTGGNFYKCDLGYRVLDLHYDTNTDTIYYVIETAQDDLDDTTNRNNNEEWRGKEGIYYDEDYKQFILRPEGGSKGEKSPRIYFGEVTWANRKAPTFDADKRLKKYHKGIHVYSKRIVFSSTTKIDSAQREDYITEGGGSFPTGFWRGKEVSQMIGSGTPAVDRRLGVPLPLNRLVCKLAYDALITANEVTFGPDYASRYMWNDPDTSRYIKKGSHVYLMQIPTDQDDTISNGNICYMGKIWGISKQGSLHTIKTTQSSLFNYRKYDAIFSPRSRVIIIPESDHPTNNIPIPEFESLDVIYNDGPDWFQYAWSTKEDIEIEKRRGYQQRINFFFKTSVDTLSESSSYEPEPSHYSFTSNAEIEGFYGYKSPTLSKTPQTYGYWNQNRTYVRRTEPDGTWTSAEPIPFHIAYKFIDKTNQFKWRYPVGGPIQRFAVANSYHNPDGGVNPDAGRPNAQSSHYTNKLFVYRNGAWRPVTKDYGGGYFKSAGNVWLSIDKDNDLWVFANDFESSPWPSSGATMPAKEFYNSCRIFKWVDDTSYPAGGRLERKFIDRVHTNKFGNEYLYNYSGYRALDREEQQPVRLPTLFTGPGMHSVPHRVIDGGRKTFYHNRDNTGIRVLGACHVELGQNITDLVVGIKGYSGGVQPILILEGDVSEKFDVGDTIELRWTLVKGEEEPNPLFSPHVTYQVLNVETKTANFEDARKIMKGWDSKLPGVEGKYNDNQLYNFKKLGFWTLLTVEGGVPFGDYSQYEEPESVQLSILEACVEKDGLEEAIQVNTDGQIEDIINSGNYYYIYKVGKAWPIASRYTIETLTYGKESMDEFLTYDSLSDSSIKYSDIEQVRLLGDFYKSEKLRDIGETVTPKLDEEYNKIPYATLSKKRFAYITWLSRINFYKQFNNYNLNKAYNWETVDPDIDIYIKDSNVKLLPILILSDAEIYEPQLNEVLVKPNTGDDLQECRLLVNRALEGVDIRVDYRVYVEGRFDGFNTNSNLWGSGVILYTFSSNEYPFIRTRFDGNVTFEGVPVHEYPLITQKGIQGTPVPCPVGVPVPINKSSVMLSNTGNLMVLTDNWAGYVEEFDAKKTVWGMLQTLAIANNCYIIPNSSRYNEEIGSSNPMGVTLYPRKFKGRIISTIQPTKIKRIPREEYNKVITSFKHGKAIAKLEDDEDNPGTTIIVPDWSLGTGNAYKFSCNAITDWQHAYESAKTVLQWLYFGVEYELNLGYLASWLQVLDSVEFTYINENATEGGIEGEDIKVTAYITDVTHKVGQEGNGTTTLKVMSYLDTYGEPFNPGNPEYKSPPPQEEVEPA